jgi:dolichol-phosphate mannosyltransferase
MSEKNIELSIIVPLYNEENNIGALNHRIITVLESMSISFEIIYINDGSKDNTLPLVIELSHRNSSIKFIDLSRNFGHQQSITAGIQYAQGKYLVIMDGDGQDPPELIPELYQKAKSGYEVVYAKRKKRQGEGIMKKFTAKIFYRFLAKITNIQIPVDAGDFRIIHQKVQKILNQMPEQHKYIRGQIAWIGFNQTYIEYDREERMSGETKFTYRKMIGFALDGISGFSTWPLRVATISGFFVSFIAFLLIIYSLYQKYIGATEKGWTSLHISVLFIGGIQLIGIGILGEYIGRVSENVKNRPHFIIRDSNFDHEQN